MTDSKITRQMIDAGVRELPILAAMYWNLGTNYQTVARQAVVRIFKAMMEASPGPVKFDEE